ncbi:unnamed protein product [Didymodactylos carnosus]|uniref:Uncharacterized protein n=1 Tax=Didymodactylos carnosus TaxID=1234261 RepID=A0A814ADQ5_9BILA|nr:unnamed protein product [Didymodactylos carnosus]CAF3692608.1 unnamed protein product [Didymodactylos carnosus]
MKESAPFCLFQILFVFLRQMSQTQESKEQMLDYCKSCSKEDKAELKKIKDFRNTYDRKKAVEWYTKDSFIYRLVNRALTREPIYALYLLRFYITDLYLEIEGTKSTRSTETTYRGQIISKEEIDMLNDNSKNVISVSSFFSTTRNPLVTKRMIEEVANTENLVCVLFEIEVNHKMKPNVCIDIHKYLGITSEESEVLFNLGTVFKIKSVAFDDEIAAWKVNMVTTNGILDFQDYLKAYKTEITNINELFGSFFRAIGGHTTAEQYFQLMLKNTDRSQEATDIYDNIGDIKLEIMQLLSALKHYKSAYEIRK